ncbi:MAG TPA: VOC family protein, partial [Actinomycetota bacterium]|nr:VOC family protein [Actinomycetota bacterium]
RFYRDVVGLKPTLGDEDGVYVEFVLGEAVLALFDRRRMMEALGTHASILAEPERVGDASVVCLEVEDLDAEVARLQEAGVRFVTEPHDQPTWHVRVAHFRDPEGNLIELNHPLEGAS